MEITIVALIITSIGFISIYNSLVMRRNAVEQSWGGIQAYLKKRYDLIPKLVELVNQYAQHETTLLTEITQIRTNGSKPGLTQEEQILNGQQMKSAFEKLQIAVENYPDLKANENFKVLKNNMSAIEDDLSAARRAYNSSVTLYNNKVEMFPHNLVARVSGFRRKAVFDAEIDVKI
jgi:LemA protein